MNIGVVNSVLFSLLSTFIILLVLAAIITVVIIVIRSSMTGNTDNTSKKLDKEIANLKNKIELGLISEEEYKYRKAEILRQIQSGK